MEEEKFALKIKIFNCILIAILLLVILCTFFSVIGSEDEGALVLVPITIVGCTYISILLYEIIDLKINRGFYQIKAMFNSFLLGAPGLVLLIFAFESGFALAISIVVLLPAMYHYLLARNDLKVNHPEVNIKMAILSTVGVLLTIPALIFLIFIICSFFD